MSYQFDENVENEMMENKKKSQKKVLTFVVLGLVILVTIVAVSFLTRGGKSEPQEFADLDQKLEKVVENTPQNTTETQDTNAEIEQFMQDLQNQREKSVAENELIKSEATKNEMPSTSEITIQDSKPAKSAQAKKVEEKEKPKKIAKIEKSKPKDQDALSIIKTFENVHPTLKKGIYLQVGVFVNTPNTRFIKNIKKYPHHIQKAQAGDKIVSKYLVGPFTSREEAQKQVPTLTKEFQRPFVVEVK